MSSQIWIMRIVIPSLTWALLGFRPRIWLIMSSSLNKTLSKILSVIGRKRGNRPPVLRRVHWLTKELLNKVAFS